MFSIGSLSKKTGVKVPTIRYYEQIGLIDTQARIASLQRLETELIGINNHCDGDGYISECYVLSSLGDHGRCISDHHSAITE